uniref:WASF1_0 protein n=1 Tax=Fopius arisanus TaxID=64838 RepID=A0A0C9RQA7_9HYME
MPFVVRKIEPRYVGRGHVPQNATSAETWPVGAELGAVSNGALASTLKQLASLLSIAEDIFGELTAELTSVADRSGVLRRRIDRLDDRLASIDPKKIPVPESDICTFALRKDHFKASREPITGIFASVTRPRALQQLYDAAATVAVRNLDSLRREKDGSSMEMYLCTPVLGKRRRDQSLDIESRVPAVLEDLRRWTSSEALGDITVPPDCASRILQELVADDAVDHKLPSPEEQVQAIALKFPAEIVAVDVSGRGFERMSMRRRSLLSARPTGENQDASVKRRSRPRRPRGKRRNTIAGTDRKEIRRAVGEESTTHEADASAREDEIISDDSPGRAHRSASTDILGKKESPTERKWHFDTLRAWGMSRLKLISPKYDDNKIDKKSREAQGSCDDTNVYEMINTQRRKRDKSHERKPSSSSSSGKSIASSIAVSIPLPERPVKLRECAAQKRERRKGGNNRDDPPHSSSGNWSASSESGRASIGSETTTNPPRSTTTTSTGTCSISLSHARRLRGRDTSTSSSVTSEGTLTPDIIQDIGVIPFSDDAEGEGETCSVYSCDTEGYYTSFHMDSGLKTLREEETIPQAPLTKSNEVSPDSLSPLVENEYELFGRGSTSTTTSSAGTVCTTLLAPPPPERKSSLTVVAMVHGQNKNGGESPDSGHNTSSSPVESASSPACTGRSCSELEYSESSDLEGCDRIERIRSKTAINTSRIPSMCVITPPGSDDETSKEIPQDSSNKKTDGIETNSPGAVLMSATVGTSKMEVINGQDKNLYATVQTIDPKTREPPAERAPFKTSPLSGMLDRIRGVLPLSRKQPGKTEIIPQTQPTCHDSGDYVTIADVRNNNDKGRNANQLIYSNGELLEHDRRDTEYISLSELPKKPDSSLERKRQGARVTLDSDGKVVYSSDSLKRRKGTHTTFNPGPFVKETSSTPSPTASPMFRRAQPQIRAVSTKQSERIPRPGKLVIRAGKSPERTTEKNEREKQTRGAYVNVQSEEGKRTENNGVHESTDCTDGTDCNKGKIQRTLTSDTCHFDNKTIKSRVDTLNYKENDYCPEILRAKGNTPKLTRKLLISNFDSSPSGSLTNFNHGETKIIMETVENPSIRERKIKRSESYRMANSPILFIKKISCNADRSTKIIRTASEELREDLMKERINYPDSVASPTIVESTNDFSDSSWSSNNSRVSSPMTPRPRAQDIEPARVLKYSSNDTEIW